MKITPTIPPRTFEVGLTRPIRLTDCARIALAPDEQVTFVTPAGAEYDVVRKAWGFYATPSLNGRLARFGLRPVLIRNPEGLYFLFLVERGKEEPFERYLAQEAQQIVAWLDSDVRLAHLERALSAASA